MGIWIAVTQKVRVLFHEQAGRAVTTALFLCCALFAPTLTHAAAPTCPLTKSAPGDVLIAFDGISIEASNSEAKYATPRQPIEVPAGTYSITAATYEPPARTPVDDGPYESWHLAFIDSSGNMFFSSTTVDIPDGPTAFMQKDMINAALTVPRGVVAVQAVHVATSTGFRRNLITPICVLLHPLSTGMDAGLASSVISTSSVARVYATSTIVTVTPTFDTLHTDTVTDTDRSDSGRPGLAAVSRIPRESGTALNRQVPLRSCPFIRSYHFVRGTHDRDDVFRVQAFLNVFEGERLDLTGRYDAATQEAVRRFQKKYAAEVLAPWGIDEPTGNIYITTRRKMNEIYCGRLIPFTLEERYVLSHAVAVNPDRSGMESVKTHEDRMQTSADAREPIISGATDGDTSSEHMKEVSRAGKGDRQVPESIETADSVNNYKTVPIHDAADTESAATRAEQDRRNTSTAATADGSDTSTIKDNKKDILSVETLLMSDKTNASGVARVAAVIVGFIDAHALPVLIILVAVLLAQIYMLWRGPRHITY